MSEKKRENCTVVSQECIAAGIYSMWIQTDRIAADAKPGQFVSMYTKDKTKLLPRPISICEIDKEQGRLHLVYRVTGENTGTEEFSRLQPGDTLPVIGPLGNGFPVEKDRRQESVPYGRWYWCSSDPGACQGDELCREADCSRI